MAFALAPEAVSAGYRLIAFEMVGSTTDEAMVRARAGEIGPLWLVSRHQTAGRGRRGSSWQTPPGNLAATLLLTTALPPAMIAQLGFVAGTALWRALDCACFHADDGRSEPVPEPGHPGVFRLKWPNDVVAAGAKLAGILLQTEEITPGRRAVTIGIGVNVAAAPERLPYPATSLAALGYEVDAEFLFDVLSGTMMEAFRVWDEGRRFDAVRRVWLAHAAGIGGPVAVLAGSGQIAGTYETIDEHGQLVIRLADNTVRTVAAGEVHFGSAATARQEAAA